MSYPFHNWLFMVLKDIHLIFNLILRGLSHLDSVAHEMMTAYFLFSPQLGNEILF